MAGPEEMEAVKRAYAEMILNTAKEAASRVMAAELKARRSEHDLISTKEEASRMLLRLKQMIDAKIQEAKITSSNEHKKIDELESQLNEAEEIILDLRAELKQAQEQLYEAKTNKLPPIRPHNYSGHELLTSSLALGPEFNTIDGKSSLSDANFGYNNPIFDQIKEPELFIDQIKGPEFNTIDGKSSLSNANFGHNNPIFDQIKEPELFRNGCTQRICATETSLMHESLPIEDTSNYGNHSNNGEKVQQGRIESVSVIRRSVRKRKLKLWDDVITACGLRQLKKPHTSCFSTSKVKRCVKSGEDEFQADVETQARKDNNPGHVSFPEEKLVHSEDLPEKLELVEVLVKHDELTAACDLNSSSSIDCDVKGDTATKASNINHAKSKNLSELTFSRKWTTKSMIYPEKKSSFGKRSLRNEKVNRGL